MKSGLAFVAVVGVLIFGSCPALTAQRTPRLARNISDMLTNRAWIEALPQYGRPAEMLIFLSNGTLLIVPCAAPYRMVKWVIQTRQITWEGHDGTVAANVVSISTVELVLEVADGTSKTQRIFLAEKAPLGSEQEQSEIVR